MEVQIPQGKGVIFEGYPLMAYFSVKYTIMVVPSRQLYNAIIFFEGI